MFTNLSTAPALIPVFIVAALVLTIALSRLICR